MARFFVFLLLLLATTSTVAAYEVLNLTPDNYEEMTSGRTVFIKFYAPWVSCFLELVFN